MGRNGFLIMIHAKINLGFFLQLKLILITGLYSIPLAAHCVQSFLSPVWISVWDSPPFSWSPVRTLVKSLHPRPRLVSVNRVALFFFLFVLSPTLITTDIHPKCPFFTYLSHWLTLVTQHPPFPDHRPFRSTGFFSLTLSSAQVKFYRPWNDWQEGALSSLLV